jgi:ABC-type nitrate/sulfonate/bicarbonate transport system substrate-binding protein
MKAIALLLLFAFACPDLVRAQATEIEITADPAVYGEYPKNYQEIITKWLDTKLADPKSAQIEWTSAPKPGELPGPNGKRLQGYLVEFKVSARNRFGAFTGKQKHGALIRNGVVIKGTGFGF